MNERIAPILLLIYDGWGIAPPTHGNAITQAKKPFIDSLIKTYPAVPVEASGEAVGLTWGEMGNSEVGHLTIGAGRVIYQSLARINKSIIDGDFFKNPIFLDVKKQLETTRGSLHLIGLVSNGGVHSHQDHLYALLDFCKIHSIHNVYIHAILDGRDTKKDDGINFIRLLEQKIHEVGIGKIATLSGRFYAMDRDHHWERTELAYRAMVLGISQKFYENPVDAIQNSYKKHIFDEEFEPVVIAENQKPVKTIESGDAIIFFNFRPDRARQLTSAVSLPGFEKFQRKKNLENIFVATFTEYDRALPVSIAFPNVNILNTLPQTISEHKLKQLRIAETEKYAHVTYFFNGGRETAFDGEERILIPSPLVANYDRKPEMSAYEITSRALKEISKKIYHFIVMNFANADMVGHTGNLQATIKAVQVLDKCTEQIVRAILSQNGTVIITADHGNAESKINLESGDILKEHTKNPVPFIFVNKNWENKKDSFPKVYNDDDLARETSGGMLADIAPTILSAMNLPIPKDMVGKNLMPS